jgi:hypothetical protein
MRPVESNNLPDPGRTSGPLRLTSTRCDFA